MKVMNGQDRKFVFFVVQDDFDEREIFDLIRNINDPEHPYTLEQLDVVKIEDVKV
jgi:hypothetical protein